MFIIEDWAGNTCFFGRRFRSFENAEAFLSNELGDDYKEERGEYEIVEE